MSGDAGLPIKDETVKTTYNSVLSSVKSISYKYMFKGENLKICRCSILKCCTSFVGNPVYINIQIIKRVCIFFYESMLCMHLMQLYINLYIFSYMSLCYACILCSCI